MKTLSAYLRRLIWICLIASLIVSCSGKPPTQLPSSTPRWVELATPAVPTLEQTRFPLDLQTLPAPSQIGLLGQGEVEDAVWSSDHKMLAVAGSLGIYLYDGQTHKQIKKIPFTSPFRPQFSPDGRLLAVSGQQGRQLIDLTTGQIILSDPKLDGFMIFSPDSATLANQLYSGEGVDIYDLKTLTRTHEIRGQAGQEHNFSDAQISPDSRWLATVDEATRQIRLWDLQKNVEQFAISNHTGLPYTVNFSPDSRVLVSAGKDNSIRFWSVPDGRLLRAITGVRGGINGIRFASGDKQLRIEYGNDYPKLIDAQTGKQIQAIHEDMVYPATDPAYDFLGLDGFQRGEPAFSPDGKSLAVVRYQKAVIWDLAAQRPSRVIRLEPDIPYYVVAYAFSPAGGPLGLEKDPAPARRLSLATESILKGFVENQRTAVALSPDGKALAIGGKEAVELWDITSKTRLWKLTTPLEWITELYFSPTGDMLTVIDGSGIDSTSAERAHLIDVSTGADQNQLDLFSDTYSSHHLAVNGRWIATAQENSRAAPPIRVMDLVTGKPLTPLEGMGQVDVAGMSDFRFSPDGRLLALLRYDHLFIWSTATGKLLFDRPPSMDGCPPDYGKRFVHLAFSPDAGMLAVAYENQQVAVWDIRLLSQSAPPLTDDLLQSLPPAPTPTLTPTLPPDVLRYQCVPIAPNASSWSLPADYLLLDGRLGYGRPAILLNLKDGARQDLQASLNQESLFKAITSPDGKWLALDFYDSRTRTSSLEIRPADPAHDRVYAYPLHNEGLIGWLDNQHIILGGQGRIFASTVILNPFSGTRAAFLLEDLPDYPMTMDAMGVYFSSSNLMPDPSLNLVVFPQFRSKGSESGNYIVLWDRRTNTAVAEVLDSNHFGQDPLWSVSGQDFLIPVRVQSGKKNYSDEWFQVTRAGQVRQLSHYGTALTDNKIGAAARSPDGNRMAFRLNGQLAVLDIQTQQTISYCLPGPEWPVPVWSPDGRYLVYSFSYAANGSKVVILDTVDNKAAYLLDDAKLGGWLAGH